MKKEIYDKIKPYLVPQFKILVEQYCQELFENVSNERKQSFDSGTKPDSNDSFEDNNVNRKFESHDYENPPSDEQGEAPR